MTFAADSMFNTILDAHPLSLPSYPLHFSITHLFTPFIWWLVYLWLTFPPPYKYDCNHYPHVIDSCVCVHPTYDNNPKLDMWTMPCLEGMKARWIYKAVCRTVSPEIFWIVCNYPSTVWNSGFPSFKKDLFDNFAFILLLSKALRGMNPSKKF